MSSAEENQNDTSLPPSPSEPTGNRAWHLFWLWLQRLIFGLLGLLFLAYLIFQIPAVQTWTVQRITRSLSERLDTEVSIDYFRLGFFNKISLRGVYIEDLHRDTLLSAERLSASIDLNPITIVRKGLVINQLDLSRAQLYLRRAPDSPDDNLKLLLKLLANPDKKKETSNDFNLNLSRLNLDRVALQKIDRYKGQRIKIFLEKGLLQLQTLDIPNALIYADYVRLINPSIAIDDYERSPFFPDSLLQKKRDTARLSIAVGELDLRKGTFDLHNYRKEPVKATPDDVLNYRHLEVYDIDIRLRRFSFDKGVFSGNIRQLAAKEKSGFSLENFSVQDANVSRNGFRLNGMQLQTANTDIGDTLIFRYDGYQSFQDFENSVIMEGRFHNANVQLNDIITFAPGLNQNTFFRKNANQALVLDGVFRGTVNNLSGRDLNLKLGNGTIFRGRFSSRNLANKNSESMNLRVDDFRTNMQTLRELVPNFSPPENFNRLGSLRFNGSFDGFFTDFVAYGYLRTNIGEAEMDMQMNLFDGREQARYRGEMDLRNFDLGVWTGNTDLGKITFTSRVLNGLGITGKTARADLAAKVSTFEFKGYRYENASIAGQLEARQFDGNFIIRDDNIDFSFTGQLNFDQGVPYYNFEAFVNRLDLKALNFSQEQLVVSGDVDLNLRNRNIADLAGSVEVRDFKLETEDTTYAIAFADLNSWEDSTDTKHLTLTSDMAIGKMEGQFRLDRIPATLFQYLHQTFPEFSREIGIPEKDTLASGSFFAFDLELQESRGINRLLSPKLGELSNITFSGELDDRHQHFDFEVSAPILDFGQIHAESIYLKMDSDQSEGELDFSVEKVLINEKTLLAPITLISFLDGDSLLFSLNYDDSDQKAILGNLEMDGKLTVRDTHIIDLHFDDSKLVLLETPWQIDRNNVITFHKDSVTVEDFRARSRDRLVHVSSFGQRGVQLRADNLDMADLNEFLAFKPISLGGKIDIALQSTDVFQGANLQVQGISDTLWINGDDWGYLRFDATAPDPQSPAYTYLSLTKGSAQMILEGFYNLDQVEAEVTGQKGYFDANLDISGFPLSMAEYFIGKTVSNTSGSFDAGLRFYGTPNDPNVIGELALAPGSITVNFLKTTYAWDEAQVAVNNYLFDMTGTVLKDKYGHEAQVSGGIRHDKLKDFGFNARLTTDRFLALDTKKGDNKLFYGHALGDGEVLFTGSFQQPDVYVRASVGDSTRIVIPVSQEREASELSFLRFVDKDAPQEEESLLNRSEQLPDLKGVSLEMELEASPEAELQIIFNEQAGDIIEGQGRGAIRISVPRTGPFQMFGNYTIESGNYLFTLYNLINKKFIVQKGGTITWSGDPFSAQIDLVARYTNLNTSVANFIQEYLINAPADLQNQASNSTDVDLTMNLEGPLLQPQINFDLAFPNLRQELQSYTESKLRILKQDQNELNKQVFGLIVAGQFLPSEFTLQGTEVIYNTVSEFISNQLSLLLTELFSEFIGEGEVISGIDFDIAYNQYQQVDLGDGQNFNRGDELEVSLRQDFFNDRFSIEVGGAFGVNGNVQTASTTSGAFVGNDLVFTYILNRDRSLKLQVYQRLEPDIAGRKLQIGTGLSFQKEFDSFGEFLRGVKKAGKEEGK